MNPGEKRFVRILNGGADLLTKHADGSTSRVGLCAGTVSCAAFTVDDDLGAALKEQAIGNLTAVGVEVSDADRKNLTGHTSAIGRRLEEVDKVAITDPNNKAGICWVCPETLRSWKANTICQDANYRHKHPDKFACYNDEGWAQYQNRTIKNMYGEIVREGWGDCNTWCEMYDGASSTSTSKPTSTSSTSTSTYPSGGAERGYCTKFANDATDPPVCGNDDCPAAAFPYKHPSHSVCYNRAGYLDYLRQGWGYCGSWCSVGECPGDTCYGCSNVQSCSDSSVLAQGPPWNYRRLDEPRELPASSSTAPPSGGRRLFEPDKPHELSACEDAADEVVKQLSEEALGRTLSSCAELKDIVGGCEHEMAKMHCPQTCGLCDALGAQEDKMENHRQMIEKCNE